MDRAEVGDGSGLLGLEGEIGALGERARIEVRARGGRDRVFVDEVRRISLESEEESGRTFVAITVRNQKAEYLEWYVVDASTFWEYRNDQSLAHEFFERC